MLANCNPCGNQDQSFAEKYLNSFSWTLLHRVLFKCWIWHIHSHYMSPRFVSYLQLQLKKESCTIAGREGEKRRKTKCQNWDGRFFRVSFSKRWSLISDEMIFLFFFLRLVISRRSAFTDTNSDFHIHLLRPKPPLLLQHAGDPSSQPGRQGTNLPFTSQYCKRAVTIILRRDSERFSLRSTLTISENFFC